jgi:plasmid stabilization system protein ParE
VRRARYVLTARTAADLGEARAWSRARWGKELTSRYFDDLHEGAGFIAGNQSALRRRHELSGGTSLLVYPVREHYIVYEPLAERFIAVGARRMAGYFSRRVPFLVHFAAAGVECYALLLGGISDDPASPHYSDQARYASEKILRQIPQPRPDLQAETVLTILPLTYSHSAAEVLPF